MVLGVVSLLGQVFPALKDSLKLCHELESIREPLIVRPTLKASDIYLTLARAVRRRHQICHPNLFESNVTLVYILILPMLPPSGR